MNRSRRNAFTLVELLVVIAILSVLAAMLLPSLQNAMESARKIDCANRMKQLAVNGHIWENEFKYILPARVTWDLFDKSLYAVGNWSSPTPLYYAGYLDKNECIFKYTTDPVRPQFTQYNGPYIEKVFRPKSLALCPSSVVFKWQNSPAGSFALNDGPNLMPTLPVADLVPGSDADALHDVKTATRNISWGAYGTPTILGFSGYQALHVSDYAENASLAGILHPSAATPSLPPVKNFPEAPSRKLFFMEASSIYACYDAGVGWWSGMRQEYRQTRAYHIPHLDSANYVCYDGHVGAISRDVFIGTGFGIIQEKDLPFAFGKLSPLAP